MDLVTFETGYSLHKTDSMRVKIPRSATYFAITTNCRHLIIFNNNFTMLIRGTDPGDQNIEIKLTFYFMILLAMRR